jgi:hypothetical protein
MKYRKTSNPTFILLLIIAGIFFPAFSVIAGQASQPDAEVVMAKGNVVDYENRSKEGQKFLSELSYLLPTTHFEPLVLFLLGTTILSIVTGINLLRSRKMGFPLNSAPQADLPGQLNMNPRKSPVEKNEAAQLTQGR